MQVLTFNVFHQEMRARLIAVPVADDDAWVAQSGQNFILSPEPFTLPWVESNLRKQDLHRESLPGRSLVQFLANQVDGAGRSPPENPVDCIARE